jgi:C_GCAxxG_C_C family probable redox protein
MNFGDQSYKKIIEKAASLGYENEMNYWGCSQAVVSALIEAFGIGGVELLRASTALAGGIARRGNVCGALVGGLMMVGLLVGRDDLEMMQQYERGQEYADRLYVRFEEKMGTAICEEIQKRKFGKSFGMLSQKGRDEFREVGAHSPEGCPMVTQEGARLAAELIVQILIEGRSLARIVAKELLTTRVFIG